MNTGQKTTDGKSEARLALLHHKIQLVVRAAARQSARRFFIPKDGGRRTAEEQLHLYNIGASKLDGSPGRESRHQSGEAVDLILWDNGEATYHWPLYFDLAIHMSRMASLEGVTLRWGGHWQPLTWPNGDNVAMQRAYIRRKKNPLLDGPHFELVNSQETKA